MDKENRGYTYDGILLFSLRKKETIPFVTKWMNPEDTMLREISQS